MSSIGTNELKTIDGTKSVQVADIADGNVGIGVGQTWQDVTASRELDVEYTNDTGRPIMVGIRLSEDGDGTFNATLIVDTIDVDGFDIDSGVDTATLSTIVPSGSTYIVETYSLGGNLNFWSELR